MKKLLLLVVFIIVNSSLIIAQVPQAINYQGIVRDANGDPISNSTANVRFTIRETNPTGNVVFQEFHVTTSNLYGLINLPLGQGSATQGFFNQINWDQNSHFLQVEAHPGSPPYVDLGTTQFLSVPYSQHASTADQASNGIPAGFIGTWAGPNPPSGWLICDGSEVSRTTYSALFSAIGNAWGAGNGATTFHLPDLRGRFLRGVDQGAGNDPDAASRTNIQLLGNTGDTVGSFQLDELKSHSHLIDGSNVAGGIGTDNYLSSLNSTNQGNNLTATQAIRDTGGNETRPKNANVYFIIKY